MKPICVQIEPCPRGAPGDSAVQFENNDYYKVDPRLPGSHLHTVTQRDSWAGYGAVA